MKAKTITRHSLLLLTKTHTIMKNLIALIIIGLVALSFPANAQNARKDATGNYIAINHAQDSTAKQVATFTDSKGIKYPVFISAKGKLFYMRTSKAGNVYRAYLKVN